MSKPIYKYIYIIAALLIVLASLVFTNRLSDSISQEERTKMRIWAEAMIAFSQIEEEDTTNFMLIWHIIESNKLIPVIIADKEDIVINYVNINKLPEDRERFFKDKMEDFKQQNPPIRLKISEDEEQYIYYGQSYLLWYLRMFPYVQLSLISVLLIVFFWAFASDKRAEQNRVWVGLSKETAHQLGTPISSLLAWQEIMKDDNSISPVMKEEMAKDIMRLQTISDRFSKIGSEPALKEENIVDILQSQISYLRGRTSNKVKYELDSQNRDIKVKVCRPLFEWVVENLSKNAVDAMSGAGIIKFSVKKDGRHILVDIQDTGKGIAANMFKQVFLPGFTTKQRGWGLGLSLSKRIIENYHKGKIFILSSEVDKGTTFRIVLRASL